MSGRAVHSGRGYFLSAVTSATPRSRLLLSSLGGVLGEGGGQKSQERKKEIVQNSASVLACKPCVKVDVCERQLRRAESLQNFPERARGGGDERQALPGMKFLAPWKLRVQLEHSSRLPSALFPSTSPHTFRAPSLPSLLPYVLSP